MSPRAHLLPGEEETLFVDDKEDFVEQKRLLKRKVKKKRK